MKRNNLNDFKRFKIILYSWVLFLITALSLGPVTVNAAMRMMVSVNQAKAVSGRVLSSNGTPVFEVTVSVKGTQISTLTDDKGQFKLTGVSSVSTVVFTKDGYQTIEQVIGDKAEMQITMKSEKYVELLWTRQKDKYVTGAVSSISGEELETLPGANRNNVLGGRLAGLTVLQANGEPGVEASSLYIRGLRTLGGAQQTPYILVDGYARDNANYLNPYDIESITVLKDAASTAMYGLRGGNGVVLITTKRGKDEPIKVTLDAKYGYQEPTQMAKYLDSYNYAYLYNEAQRNAGLPEKYSQSALEAYKSGTDPYAYPNVDWGNEFLKKNSPQQDYNLSMRGGNKSLRYYASAGYVKSTGLYNVDKNANTYNTNLDFNVFRLRSNIDVQVTKRFQVSMEIGERQETRNYPGTMGSNSSRIIGALNQLPPNAFPIFNSDLSLGGTSQYTNDNPYGLLNSSGYSIFTVRNTDAAFKVKYDLDFITKGLSARGAVSFDSYFEQTINRNKGFLTYEGSLLNVRGVLSPATQQNGNSIGADQRVFDMQGGLDYDRTFGKHNLTGTLLAEQTSYAGDGGNMPHYYQGLMGRANYIYDGRYIAQVTFGYQGSEQTSDNKRFVLFPAVSVGWIASEESFLKGSEAVNFLKIRASHGLTGNDNQIGYFQKFSFFEKNGSYLIGDNLSSYSGFREGVIGDPNITCEKERKSDIGIDGTFFNNHFSLSADVFYEKSTGIIVDLNRLPTMLGALNVPTGNAGIVENKGYEIQLGYNNKIGDVSFGASGSLSYAKNKIIDQQEADKTFSFNYTTGYPIGSQFGLHAIGFFNDAADIAASPVQSYGAVRPGDLKYKDMTGDNIIDVNDISYIGKSWMPEIVYGVTLDLGYKGFDFSALVEGINNVATKLSGTAYWEFEPNGLGKVMEHHQSRWAYYPDLGIDTRSVATYPELSLSGSNTNNKAPNSDFWLKDASYVRLKSVEIGYTFPSSVTKILKLSKLRVYANGYNLLTFDKIKVIDPEMPGDGVAYPIQRMVNVGITAQF